MNLKPYESAEDRILAEDACIICGGPVESDLLVCSATCSDAWGVRQGQMNARLYDFQNGESNDW